MSIYSKFEAYDYLEIGRTIGYYVGDPASNSNKIRNGIITDLVECENFEDGPQGCLPCECLIEIDNKRPECFRYGNDTGIRYVIVKEFLDEKDFKV